LKPIIIRPYTSRKQGYKVECALYVGDDEIVPGVGMARQVKVAPLVKVKHTQLKHHTIDDMVMGHLGLDIHNYVFITVLPYYIIV